LNQNRNPHLNKLEIERVLKLKLGGEKVIWLPFGLAFDNDTNGHVDNIATFARSGEIIISWTDDKRDENYERCKAAEKILLNESDAKGRQIKIYKLHIPYPMVSSKKCLSKSNLDFSCMVLSIRFVTFQFL